jgi:hypothetical protein
MTIIFNRPLIKTLEGDLGADVGDYVIKGGKGRVLHL